MTIYKVAASLCVVNTAPLRWHRPVLFDANKQNEYSKTTIVLIRKNYFQRFRIYTA